MSDPADSKTTRNKKTLVAMSGGVDSSIAAKLLLDAGFDCAGVFMITNDQAQHAQGDAEAVAESLGMKLEVLDLRNEFEEILEYFSSEYKLGRTPNPCVFCNRRIKFGRLWEYAQDNGFQSLATGHYARILAQGVEAGLYEATQAAKDQSYVLAQVYRDALPFIALPMGDYSKAQTREMARKQGLFNSDKADSQEICFIPDDDYVSVLEQRCPGLVRTGKIDDSSGNVLGEHEGVHRFTIGQRRGLGVAMGTPYYVSKIDAENNVVTLGPKAEVIHRRLSASGVNWLVDEPTSPFRAKVRVRYNDKGSAALVVPEMERVVVEFDEPKLAITPGQLAAFYAQEGDLWRVVGSAWIDNVSD